MRWMGIAALALAACGSDPGEGTKTLYVDASLRYELKNPPTVKVEVMVRRGSSEGPGVTGANVRISGAEFLYAPTDDGKGKYKGEISTYTQDMKIEIQSGADNVSAFLEGPDAFKLIAPANGSAVDVRNNEPVRVEWDPESGRAADQIEIDVSENETIAAVVNVDEGFADVKPEFFRLGQHRIVVRRSKSLLLEGGVAGSLFRMSYAAEASVTVLH